MLNLSIEKLNKINSRQNYDKIYTGKNELTNYAFYEVVEKMLLFSTQHLQNDTPWKNSLKNRPRKNIT